MGEICVNLYTLQELISQDLGLQWSLELQSGLRSRSSQWTSTCQNSVRRKTIVRIISFIVSIYCNLKKQSFRRILTFIPLQSCSILLCCKQSWTSSTSWKLDCKYFDGYKIQSRILKSLGRCVGTWRMP